MNIMIFGLLRSKSILINIFTVDSEYFNDFAVIRLCGEFLFNLKYVIVEIFEEFCFSLGNIFRIST